MIKRANSCLAIFFYYTLVKSFKSGKAVALVGFLCVRGRLKSGVDCLVPAFLVTLFFVEPQNILPNFSSIHPVRNGFMTNQFWSMQWQEKLFHPEKF